jgi:hypothetical protein
MSASARAARFYRLALAAIAVAALSALVFVWLRDTLPAPQQSTVSRPARQYAGQSTRQPSDQTGRPAAATPPAESSTKESRDEPAPVPLIARTLPGPAARPRGPVGTSKITERAPRRRGGDPSELPAVPLTEIEALRDAPAAATPSAPPMTPPEPVAPSVPPAAPTRESIEVQEIQQVLARYERAYDRLDASAAAAVWPSVDLHSLERAFARLREQDLQFNRCVFGVSSDDATVTCSGELRYVRRFGSTTPRTEARSWIIQFEHVGDEWRIVSVVGR